MTVRQKMTDCQKFRILSVTHGSDRPNIPELPEKNSHRLHHPLESYGHFSVLNFVKKWQKKPKTAKKVAKIHKSSLTFDAGSNGAI